MQDFDYFEIRINRSFSVWTQDEGLLVAEIYINQQPLIELVRKVEESLIQAEIKERRAAGEDINELDFPSGDYLYLPPSMVLLPSRNLLDEPWNHGFNVKVDDPRKDKATILGCACGVIECWLMQVRITLNESTVEWSDFGQFHRDWWKYNLGSFKFDREQYEYELNKTQ